LPPVHQQHADHHPGAFRVDRQLIQFISSTSLFHKSPFSSNEARGQPWASLRFPSVSARARAHPPKVQVTALGNRLTGRRTEKPWPIFTGPAESARTGVQDEKASGSFSVGVIRPSKKKPRFHAGFGYIPQN